MAYRSIPDPAPDIASVRESVLALKETVEVLSGQRKPVRSRAVTYQDLLDLGLIAPDQVPTR